MNAYASIWRPKFASYEVPKEASTKVDLAAVPNVAACQSETKFICLMYIRKSLRPGNVLYKYAADLNTSYGTIGACRDRRDHMHVQPRHMHHASGILNLSIVSPTSSDIAIGATLAYKLVTSQSRYLLAVRQRMSTCQGRHHDHDVRVYSLISRAMPLQICEY
jgi:hypothetical protein